MKEKLSLVAEAYHALKQNIITGAYAPEQVLYETDLAKELGMSRQPVHQAIHQLYEEGWFSSVTRRNIRVQGICLDDIQELYCIRKVLERSALQEIFETGCFWQASFRLEECLLHMQENERDTVGFHQWHYEFYARLLNAFASPKLEKFYIHSGMEQILRLNLLLADADQPEHFRQILIDSRELVRLIRENQAQAAESLYLRMWQAGRQRLEQQLAQHGEKNA